MIVVIGCGNSNRRDDGVGPFVIRRLKARLQEDSGLRLFDAGTDGMAVMFQARGARTLIIVDAAANLAAPGAVYEVPGSELERAYSPGLNLHDFRWDSALHAGRQIFREAFPSDVVVYLIGAGDLGLGLELTAAVEQAGEQVAATIEALITARRSPALPETARLPLKRGALYFTRAQAEHYFPGRESVVLLRRDNDLLILPVAQAAAGGYLLKQRNAAGDRVVHAPEFFRDNGFDDDFEGAFTVEWRAEAAALVAEGAFDRKQTIQSGREVDSDLSSR